MRAGIGPLSYRHVVGYDKPGRGLLKEGVPVLRVNALDGKVRACQHAVPCQDLHNAQSICM